MKDNLYLIGALTSKPYAFSTRPWELENIESIDYHDGIGSNIQVSVKGSEIVRVLPKGNTKLNSEWITDKIRFSYDGLKYQRLFYPTLKQANKHVFISWKEAFKILNEKQKKLYIEGVIGNITDAETCILFKEFINYTGNGSIESRNSLYNINSDLRYKYLTTQLQNLENKNICILMGLNPRLESPLLNLKIRKNVLNNNLKVYNIGYSSNLTYNVIHLNNNVKTIINIIEGKHLLCQYINNKSIFLAGLSLYQQLPSLFNSINNLKINFIHQFTTNIIGLEYNLLNLKNKINYTYKNKLLYILNSDDISFNKKNYNFIVYQGHTGNKLLDEVDLILPTSTLYEKNGTLLNLEGLHQKINFCVKPPQNARNDWKLFQALLNYSNFSHKYTKLKEVQQRLIDIAPMRDLKYQRILKEYNFITKVNNIYFNSYLNDFYMSDIISKNSNILALTSSRNKIYNNNFINTNIK